MLAYPWGHRGAGGEDQHKGSSGSVSQEDRNGTTLPGCSDLLAQLQLLMANWKSIWSWLTVLKSGFVREVSVAAPRRLKSPGNSPEVYILLLHPLHGKSNLRWGQTLWSAEKKRLQRCLKMKTNEKYLERGTWIHNYLMKVCVSMWLSQCHSCAPE